MNKDSFLVTEKSGPRPAGKPDECFYCGRKIGQEHVKAGDADSRDGRGCVMRRKSVVISFSCELVYDVPEDWKPEDIHFNLNHGSRCADNTVSMIERQLMRNDTNDEEGSGCMCTRGNCKHAYLREATEEETKRAHIVLDDNDKKDTPDPEAN